MYGRCFCISNAGNWVWTDRAAVSLSPGVRNIPSLPGVRNVPKSLAGYDVLPMGESQDPADYSGHLSHLAIHRYPDYLEVKRKKDQNVNFFKVHLTGVSRGFLNKHVKKMFELNWQI